MKRIKEFLKELTEIVILTGELLEKLIPIICTIGTIWTLIKTIK